jgi:hypothetical protein
MEWVNLLSVLGARLQSLEICIHLLVELGEEHFILRLLF